MDPATLRIKFTPLIKHFSKCSLQIVPELSDIQNLNKINWKYENDFIEYIVPMTYKIVLSKNQLNNSHIPRDDLNKTYHSCVDLLLTSPVTNMNLESGDVQRVISDTFILRQMMEDDTNIIVKTKSVKNNFIATSHTASNNNITKENNYHCIAYNKSNSSLQPLALYSKAIEEKIDDNEDLFRENIFTNNSIFFNNHSAETAVNTISDFNLYTETLAQSVGTVNKSTTVMQVPAYPIYRLTVTPVCIINTGDKIATIKKSITTETFNELNTTRKNLISIKTYKKDKNLSFEENFPRQILSSTVKYDKELKRLREFGLNNRILPEIRITEFITFMEKEIMPLKLMLHEILQKCSTLGITCTKESCSDQKRTYQKQQTSNRFVYTIVFDGFQKMDSESAVEQFVRNLSFEIETTTQDDPLRLMNRSKSTPLNVKVRLRNKNELPKYGVISVPKAYMGKEKMRLANSDQTVMSFDLFMEPDLQKKPARKRRRKLLEIIRQSTCLGTQENDEDLRHLPSSSYKQSSKEQSVSSNSDYLINQATALSKRIYLNSSSTLPKNNNFLGKCKPGGCLDPPFGEDKYSYSPTINRVLEPTKKQINTASNIVLQSSSSITSRTANSDASAKHKTIMNEQKDRNVILKLYEAESVHTSLSTTHSNSIITYPPTLTSSECRIYNDKNMNNNITVEVNKLQNTGNHLNNAYFIPPKKVVKHHEKKKSEIPNLSIEKANTLNFDMHNMILDNDSEQRKNKKSIHLGHPTYVDTKLKGTNNDDEVKIEAVEINQQDKKDTKRELSFKEIHINEDQKSLPTTLSGYLLLQDARSHVSLSNDIEIDLPLPVHTSNKLKLEDNDQSRINVHRTLKQNSHHSSGTSKNLNTDFNSEILAEYDNNILTNIIEENRNILDKKLTNTKAVSLVFDESIYIAIKQLSNDQNTTYSQNILELTSDNQPTKYTTANDLSNTMNFMSKTKVCIDQDVPKVHKTSSRSNESINSREYDRNLTKHVYTENKQNDEKNLLLISEKLEGLTTSTNLIQDSHSNKKNNISPRDTTTEAENLSINNKIKILTKHSLLSVNRRLEDTTHNNSVTKYIFINKMSVPGKAGPGLEESDANHSSSLDHIPDSHIVTHISDLSINNGKQRFLQDESKVDTLDAAKKENSASELSIRSSLVQKSDTELFHDRSQTINLKDTSDSVVLIDTINQNSDRNTSFSSDRSLNMESVFPVRNNGKNESDMESQLPSEVSDKNNFQIVNSLSQLSSQLIPRNENVPLLATQPHEMSNHIYNQKSTTEGPIKSFEMEDLSVLYPVASDTSRIYIDKQLFNEIVTLTNVKDELDLKINKNSETYVSIDTGTTDLQELGIQSQNEYSDVHKNKIFEDDLKTFSHITVIRANNVLAVNDKEKKLFLDFDKEVFIKNLTSTDVKDELDTKINKNSETYVSTITGTTDLQVFGTQSQNEYSDVHEMNIPEHELKTISRTTLIRANNVLEVSDKEKELSLDFDKEVFNKNLTSTDVKDELDTKINNNSETYVLTITGTTDLQLFGTQSQNEYSDVHKMNIPEHELKTISHTTLIRANNVLEVNDKEEEPSLDLDKELINKNLTSTDVKDELDTKINKNSEIYVSTITIPEHDLKTISCTTLIRSKSMLREDNDKGKELSVDLAFQVYCNDKNQKILKSLSSAHEPKRYPQDTLFKLKTEIRAPNYKVIVPNGTKNDLTIYIAKVNDSVELPQCTMNKGTQATEHIKSLNNEYLNKMVNELRNGSLLSICENELIPLQMAIKGLKEEIDSLAEQQLIFKNSLISVKKTKLIRVSNVGRRCGCLKSYY